MDLRFASSDFRSRFRAAFLYWSVMPTASDNRSELKRLQLALEAVSKELAAIEKRPHFSPRHAAQGLAGGAPDRLETFVNHFALAMKRSTSYYGHSWPCSPTAPIVVKISR
jgi:hypothetical protein